MEERDYIGIYCDAQNGEYFQRKLLDGIRYCELAVDKEGNPIRIGCNHLDEGITEFYIDGGKTERHICNAGDKLQVIEPSKPEFEEPHSEPQQLVVMEETGIEYMVEGGIRRI
jgi:hypothetical protein|tara:strand:+ start:699 stop:1037 length:339 start_codon:yes stop_codon:yes gene_type:complete